MPAPAVVADVAFERTWLDETSWVDVARGLVADAQDLHDVLTERQRWNQGRVYRYDHWVDEPRMGSLWRAGDPPPHPVLADVQRTIQDRYRVPFAGAGMARYRDGRDGQAFHRDRDMRWLNDTLIAILSLGQRRPWLLRPRANRYAHELDHKGATHDFNPAGGDLLVMGGRCQADWEHSVPQVRRPIGSRISLQWRWTSRTGRPVVGASYRAPRHYSR